MQTKSLNTIESKMETLEETSFRYQVLDAVKKFKTNWINLAKYLYIVKKNKHYKEWGYNEFDAYCSKEIGIKRQTVFKLLGSYYFLTKEEPQFLEDGFLQRKSPRTLPDYEAINILRRAKSNKGLNEEHYNQLKQEVLEKAAEPREVGRQFRSMLWAVKSTDPEEEKRKNRITTIKRLISTLKTLKKEVELLKLLPGKYISEVDRIISSLEKELEVKI